MNRLERVREVVDNLLRQQTDVEEKRCGFVHLYGVAQTCTLLALKRGLNPEIATTAGMLHDIWSYKTADSSHHAEHGAVEAKRILEQVSGFSTEEISLICEAIRNHGKKNEIQDDMSELLKDADVLQHYLYNTSFEVHRSHIERLNKVLAELDVDHKAVIG